MYSWLLSFLAHPADVVTIINNKKQRA